MIFAFELALNKRLIGKEYYLDSINLIKKYHLYSKLKPITKQIITIMEHDKKVQNGKINFIAPFYPKAVETIKISPKSLLSD
jgi:3-dehydroquinate synthetase